MISIFRHSKSIAGKLFRIRIIFVVILLALLVGILALGLRALNNPAVGTVNENLNQSETTKPVVLKDFDTVYFSTKYSGRYSLQKNNNQSASLDSWVLVAHQAIGVGPSGIMSVTIAKLPTGGVKENSAYKLFEAFPDVYDVANETHASQTVVVAERTKDNYEHTALWSRGVYLLTVSVTSNQKNDLLVQEFNTFLDNLIWKS